MYSLEHCRWTITSLWIVLLSGPVHAVCVPKQGDVIDAPLCEIEAEQAEHIRSGDLTLLPQEVQPLGFICAAEVFESQGRLEIAEEMLIRAVRRGEELNDDELISTSLRELTQFYAKTGREQEAEKAWDRLVGAENGKAGQLVVVAPYLIALAQKRFEAEDYSGSFRLVSRVSEFVGEGFGSERFAEDWIPTLYVKVGRSREADRLYHDRILLARSDGNPGVVSSELQSYAEYLRTVGRAVEAAEAEEEANAIRRELGAPERDVQ